MSTKNQELENQVLEILESIKSTLTRHRNGLIELIYDCRTAMQEQENKLNLLGKTEVQNLSKESENIQTIFAEIEAIEKEISEL